MQIEIPDDVALKTGLTRQAFLEIMAVSLYKMEKINGVQGGKIIGKSELEFHTLLGKYGQTINYDSQDLLDDLDSLKKL
jgi:predicted HTH domain antitoxin